MSSCQKESRPYDRNAADHAASKGSAVAHPQQSLDSVSLASSGSKVRLLEGLSKPERESILASATRRHFPSHSIATEQEQPADRLFLLVKGRARYFFIAPDGRKIYLLWLISGEIFGGASLLAEPSRFLVGTEIVKESCVLVWERKVIRSLTARYPRLLENGLSIAMDYLTWYLASHTGLVCHKARRRLAHVLVSLANGIGSKRPGGLQIDVTNEQLANTANITLFTVSRLLREWHRGGALEKSRNKILIRRPDRLFLSIPARTTDSHRNT